ncbi:MAG: M48 family metallopeptidase, partial [Planctomycetota bacterium]
GGKVAIYEGILPICETEAGLATVMSHEVAHALARHGAERVTHGYLVNGLGTILSFALQQAELTMSTELMNGYGLASKYGFVLPFSRKHEMEADHVGMMLMAQAGYDPAEAPRFWQRFADATRGGETPEFLSTHPADERRADQLLKNLDEAVAIYRSVPRQYGLGRPISFGAEPRQLVQNRQRATAAPEDWSRIPTVGREQVAATMTALAQQRATSRVKPIDLVSAELPIEEELNPIREERTKQHRSESLFKDKPPTLSVPRPIEFDKPRAVRPKPLTIPEFNPLRD